MFQIENQVLLLLIFPVAAVVGISLNLFIRARGGRSFSLHLRGFGIDLSVRTDATSVRGEDRTDSDK